MRFVHFQLAWTLFAVYTAGALGKGLPNLNHVFFAIDVENVVMLSRITVSWKGIFKALRKLQ